MISWQQRAGARLGHADDDAIVGRRRLSFCDEAGAEMCIILFTGFPVCICMDEREGEKIKDIGLAGGARDCLGRVGRLVSGQQGPSARLCLGCLSRLCRKWDGNRTDA